MMSLPGNLCWSGLCQVEWSLSGRGSGFSVSRGSPFRKTPSTDVQSLPPKWAVSILLECILRGFRK